MQSGTSCACGLLSVELHGGPGPWGQEQPGPADTPGAGVGGWKREADLLTKARHEFSFQKSLSILGFFLFYLYLRSFLENEDKLSHPEVAALHMYPPNRKAPGPLSSGRQTLDYRPQLDYNFLVRKKLTRVH